MPHDRRRASLPPISHAPLSTAFQSRRSAAERVTRYFFRRNAMASQKNSATASTRTHSRLFHTRGIDAEQANTMHLRQLSKN